MDKRTDLKAEAVPLLLQASSENIQGSGSQIDKRTDLKEEAVPLLVQEPSENIKGSGSQMDKSADLEGETAPLISLAPSHNVQGSGGQLPPLGETFTDEELKNYLEELHKHILEIGHGASEEEVYKRLNLTHYLSINAKSSDTGIGYL
jgi:hypothetical protein